jgi:hypothetical protein
MPELEDAYTWLTGRAADDATVTNMQTH